MSTAPSTSTKTNATKTAKPTTFEQIGDNPLALLAGGVAVGVLAGVLLPRVAKERELLDPIGRQIADRVTAAAHAARDAGRQEIDALIPNKDDTKERVSALFGTVIGAARDAART